MSLFHWCHYCGEKANLERVRIWIVEGMHTQQKDVDVCAKHACEARHCPYCTLTHLPGNCIPDEEITQQRVPSRLVLVSTVRTNLGGTLGK